MNRLTNPKQKQKSYLDLNFIGEHQPLHQYYLPVYRTSFPHNGAGRIFHWMPAIYWYCRAFNRDFSEKAKRIIFFADFKVINRGNSFAGLSGYYRGFKAPYRRKISGILK